MKVAWRLLRSLSVVVLLTLSACQNFPEKNRLSLVDEFANARKSSIVTGAGTVGSASFRSFLGAGLRPDLDGDWARGDLNAGPVQAFGFFLYETRPVTITVVGSAESTAKVGFYCNDKLVARAPIGKAYTDVSFPVEASDLSPGMNWVAIDGGQGAQWKDFLVRPSSAGLSIITRQPFAPSLSADQSSVMLPFGQTVDFAVESPGETAFEVTVAPWTEEAAPPLDPGRLSVSLRLLTEETAKPTELAITGSGAHRVSFPSGLGRFALQLSASSGEQQPSLPGQVGVILSNPTVLRSASPAAALARRPLPVEPVSPVGSGRRPNVILYMVDTLRADSLSVYGGDKPNSPRLEQMAKEAVTFQRVTATSSWTKPTVASTLTGLETARHGVKDFNDALDPSLTTWAEILKSQDYQTMAVVANPLLGQIFQFDQGFDRYQTVPVVNQARDLNRRARALLKERDPSKPFFLYLHPIDPHLPYNPPNPWRQQALDRRRVGEPPGPSHPLLPSSDDSGFNSLTYHLYVQASSGLPADVPEATVALVRGLYEGEVASTDAAFGELLDWLRQENLYDDTVIVFTSDHGEELLERDWLGHMHSLYQELVRVPLIIKFPKGRWGGKEPAELWQQIDVLPTVLEAVGLASPTSIDGLPFPSATDIVARRQSFFEVDGGRDAAEAGQAPADFLELGYGLRDGDWKLVHHSSSRKPALPRGLFNLDKDPDERENLLFEHPVRALFMERDLLGRAQRPQAFQARKGPAQETDAILRSLQYVR